jgi:deazaflavin-dependent oxidoreductase (nitroreductase family)
VEVVRRIALRVGQYRWFAAFVRRFGARFERLAYRATGGRFTPSGWLMPILLLTTTGRRSGRERTTPLMYLRDGSRIVVSCENFGQKRQAAWPLNLDANPRALVQLGRDVLECRARRLSEEEADDYWPRLVAAYPGHASYRKRSGQRHTFALEPVGSR